MTRSRRFVLLLPVLAALVLVAATAWGQTGPASELGRQSLRPYGHVFVAYAVAWALVAGWILSISRRLGRIERDRRE